jgi:hypothetical protein
MKNSDEFKTSVTDFYCKDRLTVSHGLPLNGATTLNIMTDSTMTLHNVPCCDIGIKKSLWNHNTQHLV